MSTKSPELSQPIGDVSLLLKREKELTVAQLRLEHAVERNVALQRIGQFLITTESREQGLEHTAKALVAEMNFEKSLIVLRNDVMLTVAASCGYTHEERTRMTEPAAVKQLESMLAVAQQSREGLFVEEPQADQRFKPGMLSVLEMKTFLMAPLMEGEVVIGFVAAGYGEANESVYAETLWLTDRDAVWFSAMANQVSSMATNAKLIASLRERTDELHAEQARLHASIDSLSLGFVLIDAAGKLVLKNQALDTILTGHRQGPIMTAADLAAAVPQVELAKGINKVQRERIKLDVKSVDLGARILRILMAPMTVQGAENPEVLGVVILFEDITEEKLLDRSKDEFFSIASHELRTPLTAIKGNSSMILNYYKDALKDASMREMLTDIHEASDRLIEIVNDFLDVSRLEQGKMTYRKEVFALDKVVESIFYDLGEVAKQKGLYLKLADEHKTLERMPRAVGDVDRTKQILYNLVGNALKFTEQGGITVGVEPEAEFLRITVTDTGRGIPPEAQKLLFRKFQQAGPSLLTRDTTRGTGLGLYISKLMAEGMGGRMALDHSTVGKGTAFSVLIPRVSTAEAATLVK